MKKVIKFLFLLFSLVLIVSCDKNEPNSSSSVTINLEDQIEQGYFKELTITVDGVSGLLSDFDYSIEINNENILSYNNYIYAKTIGEAEITVYDEIYNEVISKKITIIENTNIDQMPVFNLSSTYITMSQILAIRLQNYKDLSLFDIKLSNDNVVVIDKNYRLNPVGYGKTELFVSLKSNPLCTIHETIEVIEDGPSIFISCDKLYVGEKAYLDISNLGKTKGNELSDFTYSLSNDNLVLNEDYSVTALNVGKTLLTVTSKANELVKTTYQLEVISNDYENVKITLEEEYLGKIGVGDQINLVLNEGYTIDNIVFGTTSDDKIRYIKDTTYLAVDEGLATIYAREVDNPQNKCLYRIKIEGKGNVDYIARLLDLAIGEKGYVERYNEETDEYVNDTKYNHWYNMEGPWCAMFVSWCWYHAGLSEDLLLKYCSVYTGSEWCKEHNIFQYKKGYQPKSGDIIFFLSSGASHTGIVIYADENYVYTIEGNASNRVDIWRWSINDARITGYGTPNYPSYDGTRKDYSYIIEEKNEDGTYVWNKVSEKQEML